MIKIERANEKDACKITEIKTAAFNKEINTYLGRNGGPPGYNKVESELDIIHNLIAYKILLKDEIIGAFFLIPKDKGEMCFEDFVIEPKFQGRGFGYTVLQLVEKSYPEIKKWYLSTPIFSVGNQHLYEKFGYVETDRDEEEVRYCKVI